jgi:hypothetical protein
LSIFIKTSFNILFFIDIINLYRHQRNHAGADHPMANATTIKIAGKSYRTSLNDKGAEDVPFIEIATITPIADSEGKHMVDLTVLDAKEGLRTQTLELGPNQTKQLKTQMADARMASLFDKPSQERRNPKPHSEVFLRRGRVVSMQPHPLNPQQAKLSLVSGICKTNNAPSIPMPEDMAIEKLAKQFPKLKPEGHNHHGVPIGANADGDGAPPQIDGSLYIDPDYIGMAVTTRSAEYPTHVILTNGATAYSDLPPEKLVPNKKGTLSFTTSTSQMGIIRPEAIQDIGYGQLFNGHSPGNSCATVRFNGSTEEVKLDVDKTWLVREAKKKNPDIIDRHPPRR